MSLCQYRQPTKVVTHSNGETCTHVREGTRRLKGSSIPYNGWNLVINTRRALTLGLTPWRSFVKWLGLASPHRRTSLVFIHMLLLPERQMGEILKNSVCFQLRGHCIVQHLHSCAVCSDNPHYGISHS